TRRAPRTAAVDGRPDEGGREVAGEDRGERVDGVAQIRRELANPDDLHPHAREAREKERDEDAAVRVAERRLGSGQGGRVRLRARRGQGQRERRCSGRPRPGRGGGERGPEAPGVEGEESGGRGA